MSFDISSSDWHWQFCNLRIGCTHENLLNDFEWIILLVSSFASINACFFLLLKAVFVSADRSSLSDDVLLYIHPGHFFRFSFHSVHWCWCHMCHSKLLKHRLNVPMFQCSNVPKFQRSNIPMFQCSNVQMLKCPNVQKMFKCSNSQMLKCWNVPMSKCPNVQMSKCPNVQMSNCPKCPNVQMSKCPKCPNVQIWNVNKVKLLLELTSGFPPVNLSKYWL